MRLSGFARYLPITYGDDISRMQFFSQCDIILERIDIFSKQEMRRIKNRKNLTIYSTLQSPGGH